MNSIRNRVYAGEIAGARKAANNSAGQINSGKNPA